jgi:hypothetical protein
MCVTQATVSAVHAHCVLDNYSSRHTQFVTFVFHGKNGYVIRTLLVMLCYTYIAGNVIRTLLVMLCYTYIAGNVIRTLLVMLCYTYIAGHVMLYVHCWSC